MQHSKVLDFIANHQHSASGGEFCDRRDAQAIKCL